MPLSKRARFEIYIPSGAAYGKLQPELERELLYTFGGCTVLPGTKGSYLGSDGSRETETINLIYADTPFSLEEHLKDLSSFADALKAVALEVTREESILIVIHEIYHSV